jgi:hypothetical protein
LGLVKARLGLGSNHGFTIADPNLNPDLNHTLNPNPLSLFLSLSLSNLQDGRVVDPSSKVTGVKLEYRDEFGRKLTQKEAFRQICYRFHGYGPGKKAKEKRLKVR